LHRGGGRGRGWDRKKKERENRKKKKPMQIAMFSAIFILVYIVLNFLYWLALVCIGKNFYYLKRKY